jgi:hypothetical protein
MERGTAAPSIPKGEVAKHRHLLLHHTEKAQSENLIKPFFMIPAIDFHSIAGCVAILSSFKTIVNKKPFA